MIMRIFVHATTLFLLHVSNEHALHSPNTINKLESERICDGPIQLNKWNILDMFPIS